jgi:hypothetical protein
MAETSRPPFATARRSSGRANVGALHRCVWTFTMNEAWVGSRRAEDLVDRSASPWEAPARRPSHADKRRA